MLYYRTGEVSRQQQNGWIECPSTLAERTASLLYPTIRDGSKAMYSEGSDTPRVGF